MFLYSHYDVIHHEGHTEEIVGAVKSDDVSLI